MRSVLFFFSFVGMAFSVNAQMFGKDWGAGSYYDSLGHKTTGFIAWSTPLAITYFLKAVRMLTK
jgi:hypothetical protein